MTTTDTREPKAPESYATFWEPVRLNVPAALRAAEPRDAYQDFVNVTEDNSVTVQRDRL